MLGKLMKYDMKYMARILPWLYLGGIGFSALVTTFILVINNGTVLFLGAYAAYFLFLIAVEGIAVCSSIFKMVRIYRNMFSDEGYLTFTLPVKNGDVLNSKILTGAIWTFLSGIVALIMIALPIGAAIYKVPKLLEADDVSIGMMIESLIQEFSVGLAGNEVKLIIFLILTVVLIVISAFFAPAFYSFCCAITHKIKRARAFASVAIFIGVSYALGLIISISTVFIEIFSEYYMYGDEGFSTITPTAMIYDASEMSAYFGMRLNIMIIDLLVVGTIMAVITVVSWIVSNRIVNKKLNLL